MVVQVGDCCLNKNDEMLLAVAAVTVLVETVACFSISWFLVGGLNSFIQYVSALGYAGGLLNQLLEPLIPQLIKI